MMQNTQKKGILFSINIVFLAIFWSSLQLVLTKHNELNRINHITPQWHFAEMLSHEQTCLSNHTAEHQERSLCFVLPTTPFHLCSSLLIMKAIINLLLWEPGIWADSQLPNQNLWSQIRIPLTFVSAKNIFMVKEPHLFFFFEREYLILRCRPLTIVHDRRTPPKHC